jgi:Nitrate/nitrite transporter
VSKKKSNLQIAQEQAEATIKKTNDKIEGLGKYTSNLYTALNDIQDLLDKIRNVPSEKKLEYKKQKEIRLNWKQQVEKIESDYKNAVAQNAGTGIAGVGAGVAVAALGPTAAMGIATTFGVASTGTAISALSGAAATNAALAWLGGEHLPQVVAV